MASTPSGTNGGCCEPNIVSTVLLDFVTVMPTTLGADRSNNVDHLASDFLYHFGQRPELVQHPAEPLGHAGNVSRFRTLPSSMTSPPSQHHCTLPPSNCSL